MEASRAEPDAEGFAFGVDTGAYADADAMTSVARATSPDAEVLVPLPTLPLGAPPGSFPLGIVGGWYAFGDGYGVDGIPPGPCEMGGFMPSQCSSITFPVPTLTDGLNIPVPPGGPDGGNPGAMCLSGTAAQVIVGPDAGAVSGIGIGLDLANAGGARSQYDAPAHGIVGFTFTISGVPQLDGVGEVVVAFPTTDSVDYIHSVSSDGTYTVLFSDFQQACVCTCPSTPPFDPAHLLSVRFLVETSTQGAVPVNDMCVTDVSAIVAE
jgi:hypothetical protein